MRRRLSIKAVSPWSGLRGWGASGDCRPRVSFSCPQDVSEYPHPSPAPPELSCQTGTCLILAGLHSEGNWSSSSQGVGGAGQEQAGESVPDFQKSN